MRVGAQDRGDRAVADRLDNGVDMLGAIGAWIDHRNLGPADDVGLRTRVCECRRIVSKDPRDPWLEVIKGLVIIVHRPDVARLAGSGKSGGVQQRKVKGPRVSTALPPWMT